MHDAAGPGTFKSYLRRRTRMARMTQVCTNFQSIVSVRPWPGPPVPWHPHPRAARLRRGVRTLRRGPRPCRLACRGRQSPRSRALDTLGSGRSGAAEPRPLTASAARPRGRRTSRGTQTAPRTPRRTSRPQGTRACRPSRARAAAPPHTRTSGSRRWTPGAACTPRHGTSAGQWKGTRPGRGWPCGATCGRRGRGFAAGGRRRSAALAIARFKAGRLDDREPVEHVGGSGALLAQVSFFCGGSEFSSKGGGGGWGGVWNPKVQKFVYQKQPKSIFPFVKFHFFPL